MTVSIKISAINSTVRVGKGGRPIEVIENWEGVLRRIKNSMTQEAEAQARKRAEIEKAWRLKDAS